MTKHSVRAGPDPGREGHLWKTEEILKQQQKILLFIYVLKVTFMKSETKPRFRKEIRNLKAFSPLRNKS